MDDVKVTYKQLILLLFISRSMLGITHLPALTSPPRNQDVWIAMLIAIPIMLIFSSPIYVLWRKFPDKSIIQYSKILLGKAGAIVGLLIVFFFIDIVAINLGLISEFLNVAVFQEAPRIFFILSMVSVCSYAVYKGFEVMGRTAEIIAPIIIISVIGVTLLLYKEIKLENLKPIMEKGIYPVFQGGVALAARNIEILGLAMVLPYLNDYKKAKAVFLYFYIFFVLILLLVLIPILTVWGVRAGVNSPFPYFSLIKVTKIGDFIERIDALYMAIWVLGFYIRVSFYFYLSVLGISQVFNFNSHKPFIFPLGSILIPLTIIITPSVIELKESISYKYFIPYGLFFLVVIPSLLLIIAVITKKGEKLR